MRTPSDWPGQVFLMNFPLSVSSRVPNNPWMNGEAYNKTRACQQWLKLYERITAEALVYVLPGHDHLQDLPFVANLGCYLPHRDTMLLANFSSKPRKGEEAVGRQFFESFPYFPHQPPYCFEGEADLKWLGGNQYVGGVGMRSTKEAFRWMRNLFDMDILEVELTDPKLYHLDCALLPLNDKSCLVNVAALSPSSIASLEKITEIVPIPETNKYDSWTNSLLLGESLLSGSQKRDELQNIVGDFHVEYLDLSEFDKSGADLSCLVMHLNYAS